MATQHIDHVLAAEKNQAGIVPIAAYDATTDFIVDCRGLNQRALLVLNTGGNSLTYTILGSLDSGAAYDLVIKGDTAVLSAAQDLTRDTTNYCTHWKVRVKAAAATTCTLKFAGTSA